MTLDESTFNYLKPTDGQMAEMADARTLFSDFAHQLGKILPDGPDKTYVLRTLRTAAMWANVAITRHPDGAPRVAGQHPEYPPSHPAPGDLGSVPL